MNDEKEVKRAILRDLRKDLGLISKVASYLGYPILTFSRLYLGPGQWEINDFDMNENPDVVEKIQLMQNEAFARVSAYWSPLCARRLDYNLAYENGAWRVKNKMLSGMS